MSDIVERLRKRNAYLSLDEAADEIERLRARMVYDHECLTAIEAERDKALSDLAEAEALLREAAEYVRGFEDEDCGEPNCPECAMVRLHRSIDAWLARRV